MAERGAMSGSASANAQAISHPKNGPSPRPTYVYMPPADGRCFASWPIEYAVKRHATMARSTASGVSLPAKPVAAARLDNVEFREGYLESLPVEDGWADVVISNGVLNLVPDKAAALGEMYRVLRADGRLQLADIVLARPVSDESKLDVALWTGCIAGVCFLTSWRTPCKRRASERSRSFRAPTSSRARRNTRMPLPSAPSAPESERARPRDRSACGNDSAMWTDRSRPGPPGVRRRSQPPTRSFRRRLRPGAPPSRG